MPYNDLFSFINRENINYSPDSPSERRIISFSFIFTTRNVYKRMDGKKNEQGEPDFELSHRRSPLYRVTSNLADVIDNS